MTMTAHEACQAVLKYTIELNNIIEKKGKFQSLEELRSCRFPLYKSV
jgi:hypothetical protein